MQIIRRPTVYDACVVGSGAGSGMAAKVLTEAGATVALLEAGPMWDTVRDSAMYAWPYESPRRGAGTDRPFGEFDACLGRWELEGEPYTRAEGERFEWFRARMVGGRTNHWGRISLRFGPSDFRRRSLDGLGDDWPIGYDDMKPYYDKLDRLVGIFGSVEGLPNEPDGIFLPPPRPRCYELTVQNACDNLDITCIPARMSIITRDHNGRPACHYCGQCGRGCTTHSNFSSPSVLLPPAMETGRLTLITNAMAREVTSDTEGLATGVSYVDTNDLTEHHVRAKVIILAASACESARLMLNSTSARFPGGLGNGSGVVGKYLTDSTGSDAAGFIPKMMDGVPHNEDGVGGMHLYMPWWLDNRQLDFPRGYHIEFGGGRRMPGFGFMGGIARFPGGGGYGRQLKEDYRRYYGATVRFSGRGEMIPNRDSYCEIDPNVVDRYGIPVLKFHFKWSDHERLQVRHMHETFHAIIEEMGGTPLTPMPTAENEYGIHPGGLLIHEAGTVRMGHSPNSSALNQYCQAHEVKNLFVADGGPFTSQADKNLTWTIMALAMRTSEYVAEEMRRGEL